MRHPPLRHVPPLQRARCGAGHYIITLDDGTTAIVCNGCAHAAVMCDRHLVRAHLLAPQTQARSCDRCADQGEDKSNVVVAFPNVSVPRRGARRMAF